MWGFSIMSATASISRLNHLKNSLVGFSLLEKVDGIDLTTRDNIIERYPNFRNPKTITNDDFTVVKSALQKYCRRGETLKALWCCREVFLTTRMSKLKYAKGTKAMMTNFLNRIKIILNEDVSFREVDLFIKVMSLLHEFEREKETNPDKLLGAVWLIADKSKKSRVGSHIWCYCDAKEQSKDYDLLMPRIIENLKSVEKTKDYDKIVEEIFSDLVVYYNIEKKNRKRRRKDNNWEPLWAQLIKCCNDNEQAVTVMRLKKIFFNDRIEFRDERAVLASAVLLGIYCKYGNEFINYDENTIENDVVTNDRQWLTHHTLKHPPYVYDKHTRKGNNSNWFFAYEGARIYNEDSMIRNDKWQAFYDNYKIMLDHKKKINNKYLIANLKPNLEENLEKLEEKYLLSDETDIVGASKKSKIYFFREDYVAKHMKWETFRAGRDQDCVQELKKLVFGVNYIWGCRMLCNLEYDNATQRLKRTSKPQVFYVMSEIKDSPERCTTLESRKKIASNLHLQLEIAKIFIFRSILGLTDTNLTNILLTKAGNVYSIDENFIGHWNLAEKGLSKNQTFMINFLCQNGFSFDDFIICFNNMIYENCRIEIRKCMEKYGLYSSQFTLLYDVVLSNINNLINLVAKLLKEPNV